MQLSDNSTATDVMKRIAVAVANKACRTVPLSPSVFCEPPVQTTSNHCRGYSKLDFVCNCFLVVYPGVCESVSLPWRGLELRRGVSSEPVLYLCRADGLVFLWVGVAPPSEEELVSVGLNAY